MPKLKSSFTMFMLLVFIATQPSLALAQNNEQPSEISTQGDYFSLRKGDKAPYDGYLFDTSALIKIMVSKTLEIQQIKINKDSEIRQLNIEIDSLKKQHELEKKLLKEVNDSILKLKEDRIKILEDGFKWQDLKLFGAMLLGIGLSVAIFYASVQITKI
jgi:hypothetical protein